MPYTIKKFPLETLFALRAHFHKVNFLKYRKCYAIDISCIIKNPALDVPAGFYFTIHT